MTDTKDYGPEPFTINIEDDTKANTNFRTTRWTGKHLQLTLMSIPVGGDIGLEVHPDNDQFLRIEQGTGTVRMGPSKDDLSFEATVSDDDVVLVPAGSWHDIVNTGDEPMQVYAVYAPSHHAKGIVHETAADAEADEKSGKDTPPEWTVQPK